MTKPHQKQHYNWLQTYYQQFGFISVMRLQKFLLRTNEGLALDNVIEVNLKTPD